MKKKKEKNSEDVVARAERLFSRGNYPLAQKEFEKVHKKLKREDIAQKIAICREKSEALKVKEMLRQARKAEKKGDLEKALNCYETAAPMCSEDWIPEKMEKLRRSLTFNNAAANALRAEEAGDFQKAAELYAVAGGLEASDELALKRARCLARAGKHSEAVSVFGGISSTDPGVRYDQGLALAKIGRNLECLKVWNGLEDKTGLLAEQKQIVGKTLAYELYDRVFEARDYSAAYKGVGELLHLSDCNWTPEQVQYLEDLREYCRYAWIEDLWDKESFGSIAELLKTAPRSMGPDLLPLHAKAGFKLAIHERGQLCAMLPFWLTAVYSRPLAPQGVEGERVRHRLIAAMEELLRKHADTPDGNQAAINFKIELELIRTMTDLISNPEDQARLLCTPLYAAHAGKSDEILTLIRGNKTVFKDTKTYLETGAFYSSAGESLYLLKNGRFEEALEVVDKIEPRAREDEFIAYAEKLVRFEVGVCWLETGDDQGAHYFETAPALFEIAPDLEREFIDKALAVEEWEKLPAYEQALVKITEKRGRGCDAVRQALSVVMIRRAVGAFNDEQMNSKALKAASERALQVWPENELARVTLRDLLIDIETQEVLKSLNRAKMGKASRLARESKHPEVRNHYFDFLETIFKELVESDIEHNQKQFHLNEIYQWAVTVDSGRPLIQKMELFLDAVQSEMTQ